MSNNKTANAEANFGSRFGYIMVAAGAAIGLGNIWKFPYVTYGDGGGTFLIVYCIFAVLLGQPGVMIETAIGRHSRANAVDAYGKINKKWSFIGVINTVCTAMIDFYYMIVSGYVVKYAVAYLTGAHFGADKAAYYNAFISDPIEPLIYGFGVIALTAIILGFGITDKVEKICKVILPALLVLLIVCGIWALMISPGAVEGLKWYLVPDFSKLNGKTLADGCMQVLFSVGIGWAIFITLGASISDDKNLRSVSTWVVICDSAIAILAGFVIIPSVAGSGSEMASGPSLVFLAMTSIFEKFPGGHIIGLFFFMSLVFAVFSTAFTILEIPIMVVREKLNIGSWKAVIITSLIIFTGGIFASLSQGTGLLSGLMIPWVDFAGVHYYCIYDWIDCFSGYVLLPGGTLLTAFFVAYVWGFDNLSKELEKGGGRPVNLWDRFTIQVCIPIMTLIVILHAFGVF
ncbi:MAG: sodium-dependent transporter [Clostridiales bacterium]|nr:sodium-dependent transporter [Candidatus Crickella merdequi]